MQLDVRKLTIGGREITVLGTGVVTEASLAELKETIAAASPDHVVLDYDATRWRWLGVLAGEEEVDLVQIIRSGQMMELNARLAMGVMEKFKSPRVGVSADAEMLAAHAAATACGAEVIFGRRPTETEMLRAWRRAPFGGRVGFALRLLKGSLRRTQLEADDTRVAKFTPAAASLDARKLAGETAPVLFDEASDWLAQRLRELPGEAIVVMPACAIDGLIAAVATDSDAVGLSEVPDKSLISRALPWVFTILIISAFILGFVFADPEKMQQAAVAWFASNMSFAALGTALALAHPVTIIATSISAPFVSLNPAVGAGMVGALVQAFVAPPTVTDMDRVGDDITRLSGWWRNRLARLVLIFVFANVFSSIGSFAAFAWFPT